MKILKALNLRLGFLAPWYPTFIVYFLLEFHTLKTFELALKNIKYDIELILKKFVCYRLILFYRLNNPFHTLVFLLERSVLFLFLLGLNSEKVELTFKPNILILKDHHFALKDLHLRHQVLSVIRGV